MHAQLRTYQASHERTPAPHALPSQQARRCATFFFLRPTLRACSEAVHAIVRFRRHVSCCACVHPVSSALLDCVPDRSPFKRITGAYPPLTPCLHAQRAGRCAAIPVLRATPRACSRP
eukprot:6209745-Pleurochrysis_carterae.AAC.1